LKECLVGDYSSWFSINFLIATGCRSETLLNMRVKDINFENENILFRYMRTKRQINVPLPEALKVVLKEYIPNLQLKDEDILFSKSNGEKMCYNTLLPLDLQKDLLKYNTLDLLLLKMQIILMH